MIAVHVLYAKNENRLQYRPLKAWKIGIIYTQGFQKLFLMKSD